VRLGRDRLLASLLYSPPKSGKCPRFEQGYLAENRPGAAGKTAKRRAG
jgi:hypothetical protein